MLGRIIYTRDRGRLRLERQRFGPLELAAAVFFDPPGQPFWRVRGRLKKLERLLLRAGAGRVVLPVGFPYGAELDELRPVDPLPFYRAHGDLLALGALAEGGGGPEKTVVALSGPRVCPELRQTAERLCPVVRGICIDVPGEGAAYGEWLFRQYGVPVFPPGLAGLTVAFGPTDRVRGRVLPLFHPDFQTLGVRLRAEGWELPAECGDGLLAALWERGCLDRGTLRAGFGMPLDKWGQSTYNSIE